MGQPNPAPPTPPADPGATPPANPPTPPATGAPATDDKPLGEAGQRALAAEREARKALEKQLADQAKQLEGLAPLGELAKALGVKAEQGKTDVQTLTDQVAAMRKQMADAELRALRLEVAASKELTPAQADRLRGDTREALEADADALKALFPGGAPSAANGARTPQPDPTQGARGGTTELQAKLAEAQKAGNAREAIRLKTMIAAQKAGN